ncbi:MAG TPA: hypothetical protein VGK72_03000 [Chthoniobacterales bacterium]
MMHLRDLGIETGEEMKSDQARFIMIKDPAGNSLACAQTSTGPWRVRSEENDQ